LRVRKAIQDRRALRGLKVRKAKRVTKAIRARRAIPDVTRSPHRQRRRNEKPAGANRRVSHGVPANLKRLFDLSGTAEASSLGAGKPA
jgi:hypothetical protein